MLVFDGVSDVASSQGSPTPSLLDSPTLARVERAMIRHEGGKASLRQAACCQSLLNSNCNSLVPRLEASEAIKRGLLWQQRDRLFSRWKERYFILTRDYLHCFKRATGAGAERISQMGAFIFKVKLVGVDQVVWINRRNYSAVALDVANEGRLLLRAHTGLEDWFEILEDCMMSSKERRRALRFSRDASFQQHDAYQYDASHSYSSVNSSLEEWLGMARRKIAGLQQNLSSDMALNLRSPNNSRPHSIAPDIPTPSHSRPQSAVPELQTSNRSRPQSLAPDLHTPNHSRPQSIAPDVPSRSRPQSLKPDLHTPNHSRPQSIVPDFTNHSRPQSLASDIPNRSRPQSIVPDIPNRSRPQSIAPDFSNHSRPQSIVPDFSNHSRPQSIAPDFSNHSRPQSLVPDFSNHSRPQSVVPDIPNRSRPQSLAPDLHSSHHSRPQPRTPRVVDSYLDNQDENQEEGLEEDRWNRRRTANRDDRLSSRLSDNDVNCGETPSRIASLEKRDYTSGTQHSYHLNSDVFFMSPPGSVRVTSERLLGRPVLTPVGSFRSTNLFKPHPVESAHATGHRDRSQSDVRHKWREEERHSQYMIHATQV